jgi:transposase
MIKPAIAVLGIDLGKNRCSLAGLDASGAVLLRRRVTREHVIAFTATLPRCHGGMLRSSLPGTRVSTSRSA